MHLTEDYGKYFNLSFPATKRKLTEAVEIDELERLDAQIEKLRKEVDYSSFCSFDLERDAIWKLREDPEHSAFMAEFEELEREVDKLINSCYVETRWSTRWDPDYAIDQQAYDKIKDKVEPLKARLKELRSTYNELVHKAAEEARVERTAAREPKVAAHKASTEARAKLFNQLLNQEKANIENAVNLLNSSNVQHLSWDPAQCTFRNKTLTVPVFTEWHEDETFCDDWQDTFTFFGVNTYSGEGYSKNDYQFDEAAYVESVEERFLEDTGLYSDQIAKDLSLAKTEGGYAILPKAGWVLAPDFTIQLKDEPQVISVETHKSSYSDWWETGQHEGWHIDEVITSRAIYRVVGYLQKKF